MFIFEALPAHKGDCLLLHYGTKSTPKVVVIDGGPADVYRPSLQPALAKLKSERGLGDGQPLPIELMVVSHIDDDHIVGILELTADMVEAKENHGPAPYRVIDLWHNTFDD